MNDEDGTPMFAFQDLDYIPFGFSSDQAPYIETGPGTMRAAAKLMQLDVELHIDGKPVPTVACDLGCGDGEFLINMLNHINTPQRTTFAQGVGVDYNSALLETAGLNSHASASSFQWMVYDFNADVDDIVTQLLIVHHVTHVFVYLTPKQLELPTLKKILTRLCEAAVVVCCHKFFPTYLVPLRTDMLMNLYVYGVPEPNGSHA